MSDPKKPGPMTELALALLAPESDLIKYLDLASKSALYLIPQMMGVRGEDRPWVSWIKQDQEVRRGSFLIVDLISRLVIAKILVETTTKNKVYPFHGRAFVEGRLYGMIRIGKA